MTGIQSENKILSIRSITITNSLHSYYDNLSGNVIDHINISLDSPNQ